MFETDCRLCLIGQVYTQTIELDCFKETSKNCCRLAHDKRIWHALHRSSNQTLLEMMKGGHVEHLNTVFSFITRDSRSYSSQFCPFVCPSHGWISQKRCKL